MVAALRAELADARAALRLAANESANETESVEKNADKESLEPGDGSSTATNSERSGSSKQTLLSGALARLKAQSQPSLRRAINATGIVLHTGLGRATLSLEAQEAVRAVAAGHSLLEIDEATGRRGSRQDHVAGLLCELTGAEAAFVVNNNAGATFLAVTALASGREVVISRGELVEIGGSFRIPDIIKASGALLIEVGTTNRTRLGDFRAALTERTGLLLRCHPSNFKILGFTEETPAKELAQLGRDAGVPVMDDLGSGAMLDLAACGLDATVTLREAVGSGCDVITASGDKLLGGPQSGILLGRRDLIDQIARHPLARALRVDKLTLAALEATLRLYRDPEAAQQAIPTLRYLRRTRETLGEMALELQGALQQAIERAAQTGLHLDTVVEQSQVGGGSLPGEDLPTVCVRLKVLPERGTGSRLQSLERIAQGLRLSEPAIFARIKEGALLFDPRAMETVEFAEVAAALQRHLEAV